MEKYLVLATFVGSVIALLFAFFTGKRVLSFDEGHTSDEQDLPLHPRGRERLFAAAVHGGGHFLLPA